MTITGVKECLLNFSDLPIKLEKKIIKKSLRAGAKEILAAARANAPESSGLLKRSIKVRAGKSTKGSISIVVGVGKKWFVGPVFYAAMVAWGHKIGSRKLGGARKQVAANDFIGRAYEQKKQNAVDTFTATALELINEAAEGR